MLKRFILSSVIALVLMGSIFANPFTQKKDSPEPVQREQANEGVIKAMRYLSDRLAFYIEAWKSHNDFKFLAITLLISFVFGFVHALAPGHRKMLAFTYFLSRKAVIFEPALLGLALAILHVFSALFIMLIFKGVSGALSVATNNTSIYLEGMSFIVLIILSIYGIFEAIFSLISKEKNDKKNIKISAILLSSLYPCPAAMLILVFAINLEVFALGILAIISLSLGMSIPIIISGYLAWGGRTVVFKKFQNKEKSLKILTSLLQIVAFSVLLVISVKIALPFIVGLFR